MRDLGDQPDPRDQGVYPSPDLGSLDFGAPRDMRGSLPDSGSPRDMSAVPEDMATPPPLDMAPPPPEDMATPPVDMGQPPEGPPPSPSVDAVLNQGCTTTVVKGLSEQLIAEMNCIDPGVVSSFAYLPNLNLYAAVFPFLQTPAVQGLDATVLGQNTLTISSALRTIPQQYLLYRWYQQGRCGISLAARPGRSNHNGAKALDTPDYSAWKSRFEANRWAWLGANDPVHFTHAGGKDIRSLSVLAFQRLWNRNHPSDLLVEDGDYGPNTESRLKQSPSNGFAIPPWCPSTMQDVEHAKLISPTVRIVQLQSDLITLETYAPIASERVRYTLPDAEVDLERFANFQASLPVDSSRELIPIDITSFDADGEPLRTTSAMVSGSRGFALMPEGGGVYRLQHFKPHERAHRMVLLIDGEPVRLDPTSLQSGDPFDLMISLRPWRDALRSHLLTVVIEDVWGDRLESTDFEFDITF